ncbi:hypothetical protein AB0O34_00605 [Sphaerisporangium sp. NPDC088356]|uniref:hypothetical protein n=1 Tax=Sphaerisporangium sp. NPDC088356 TaxID=3154871 RepID=UPI003431C991
MQETNESLELIERVAATDIGKSGVSSVLCEVVQDFCAVGVEAAAGQGVLDTELAFQGVNRWPDAL